MGEQEEGMRCGTVEGVVTKRQSQGILDCGVNICEETIKQNNTATSLVVQWPKLCAPKAGGLGSAPGQGTRSHMPQQLRVCMPNKKIPHGAIKI